MHDDRELVERRIERVLNERIRPAIYADPIPLDLATWDVPDEPVPVNDALNADYRPAAIGDSWGPAWGTTWFRISGTISPSWAGKTVEAIVDLGFDAERPGFQAEGLVYTPEGVPLKALNPRNTWIRVDAAPPHKPLVLYVEAAANPTILGPVTNLGDKSTAGSTPLYRIARADLAVFDQEVWDLVQDLEVLDQLMRTLDVREPRRWEILRAIERSLDAMDAGDVSGSARAMRLELADMLGRPAHASAHRISAVGHAHIDSAWLWPVRETVRKVARTVSNVVSLMDDHPSLRFAMPQAQQLAWIKESHPALFARMTEHVTSGRFVPVGGMWVESDTNMPGGEALARQLVHGKRFFFEEFGVDTQEVWLPDSFGYSGALPQLVKLSGSRWFLGQKMSWNQTNPFPHHTFVWEGIDGTRIFAHFPPVDTYNSELSGQELAHASRTFREKGRATRSLVPFGWGDGGGGPTREMLARAYRTADLEGSPRVALESPSEFFHAAEAEYLEPAVWSGEMYLELHRGTYTSQALTKSGNRRSEHLLREAELWSATACVAGLLDYPYEELDGIWKRVLLLQFHDILPGTSIAWVHREAEAAYAQIADASETIIASAIRALAGRGANPIAFNPTPHEWRGVRALGASPVAHRDQPDVTASVEPSGTTIMTNGLIRVAVDDRGLIVSLYDLVADREVIAPGAVGNLMQLHPDLPNDWDAWDIDAFYRNTRIDVLEADEAVVVLAEPDEAAIRVTRTFASSSSTQHLRLLAGQRRLDIDTEIDWRETEKLLKLSFPFDIHAEQSKAEIQFGHVARATHTNTSWEAAKFESVAHRWLFIGEPGYGVAVVNDSTYGHDVHRDTRNGGGTTTTVRLSLLRAPRFPDPHTDQGLHRFRHAIVVDADVPCAVREGYRINLPERIVNGRRTVEPLVTIADPAAVVEALKLADDRSGDVIVRVYEAHGGRVRTRLTTSFPVARVDANDLLERPLSEAEPFELDGQTIDLRLRPFEIITLRLGR
jgi:alpha-mannosidase